MSRKILSPTRLPPALRHKGEFAYECPCRECWPGGSVLLHDGKSTELSVKTSGIFGILLRIIGFCWSRQRPLLLCSSTHCLSIPSLEDALAPPSRAPTRPAARAAERWLDVLAVHLTAPLLTVSADTGYALLQRGDLPGRTVGRKWLTTTTAVRQWLEHSATPRPTAAQETALAPAMAHGDTAALVDAVRTGHARLGTTVQHGARSGRVPGGDPACDPLLTRSHVVTTTARQTVACRVW